VANFADVYILKSTFAVLFGDSVEILLPNIVIGFFERKAMA